MSLSFERITGLCGLCNILFLVDLRALFWYNTRFVERISASLRNILRKKCERHIVSLWPDKRPKEHISEYRYSKMV